MKPEHRHVEISSRRRALFPPDENSTDSDLGCISPLNFDDVCLNTDDIFSLNKCVGDYDIIGLVDKTNTLSTPKGSSIETENSPISVIATPQHVTKLLDDSPTQKLKTPHDTSTYTNLPKLIRKPDTTLTVSLSNNQQDPADITKSKVRTALFPEMPLPAKTFYPATKTHVIASHFTVTKNRPRKKINKSRKLYLCNRQNNGQINAGVSHKIRKLKKTKKMSALKAKIGDVMKNSLVNISSKSENEYLHEEDLLSESLQDHREHNLPEPEIDPSKKFFKSCQRKGVVTVSQNIKLEVNNGKISLMNNKTNLKRQRAQEGTCPKKMKLSRDFDTISDESFEDTFISPTQISKVINFLEDKENLEEKGESVILMSPTSQMCNMTSGLALNSPKKMKNLNPILEKMPESPKLFPIFYPGKVAQLQKTDNSKTSSNNTVKKFKGLSKDQMLLDAGQKKFGVTQCSECKTIYHMGDPGDEIMHSNYHNATHIFKFYGWKNERVVYDNFTEGRVIQIIPTDPKSWWKKVNDVMEVVNRDLGFFDIQFNTLNSQIFFYIKNKTIVGVLVAEAKTDAHKLLTTHQNEVDLCSEESYPIKCGVSRIWVSHNYRKKGIATMLMETLKRNFMFGEILTNEDIAFSSPTELGKIFGKKYFKTPNFLIYFV